jgi:cytochrome c oxidase cbb3-type subunit 3
MNRSLSYWSCALLTLFVAGCDSEAADNMPTAKNNPEPQVSLVPLAPGGGKPIAQTSAEGRRIMSDPAQVAAGKQLFLAMNCVGCHSHGGGGMGPALMDKTWIYGSSIENIAASIHEGRPNGMPSFRGFLPDEQIWQVAAYVRSLSFGIPDNASNNTGTPGGTANDQGK